MIYVLPFVIKQSDHQ